MKKISLFFAMLISLLMNTLYIDAQWTEIIVPVTYNKGQWYTILCWPKSEWSEWNVFILKRDKESAIEGKITRANKSLQRRTNNVYAINPEITYTIEDPENRRTIYIVPVKHIGRFELQKIAQNDYIKDFSLVSFYDIEGPIGSIMREHEGENRIIKDPVQIFLKEYLFNTPHYSKNYHEPIANLLDKNKQTINDELKLTPEERKEIQIKKMLDTLSLIIPIAYNERKKEWYVLLHNDNNQLIPYLYDKEKNNMQSIFAKKTNNTLLYNQESTITYTEPNRTITIIPVEYISAEEIGNAHWISLDEIEKETTDPIKKTLRKHLFEGQVNIAQKLEYERKLKKNLATKTIILPIAYNANNKEWELLLYKKNDILQPLFLPEKYTNIPRKAKKITTLFHEHFDKNYPIEKKDIYAISDSIKNRHIYFSVIPYEQIPSCQWFSIQNSQQGKETDISQAVDIFLHSYLTTYKLPLEKFIAEHQRITTNITAKKIEELYKDLTALAASLI